MSQQNKNNKSNQPIFVKTRRILTRTQLSKQKQKNQFSYNNFLNDSKTSHQPAQSRMIQKQTNQTSLMTNKQKTEQQPMPHQLTRKQKTNSKFNTIYKQTIFIERENNGVNNSSYRKLKTCLKADFSPKFFDPYKPKMFNHKNLHNGTQRIKSCSTDRILSLLHEDFKAQRIEARKADRFSQYVRVQISNNQNNQPQKVKVECLDSPANKVKGILSMKNLKQLSQEDLIIKNLIKGKKRKLRLNSKEYSVNLRTNTSRTTYKQSEHISDVQQKVQTTRQQKDQQSIRKYFRTPFSQKFQRYQALDNHNQDSYKLQYSPHSSNNQTIEEKHQCKERFFIKLKEQQIKSQQLYTKPINKQSKPQQNDNIVRVQQYKMKEQSFNKPPQPQSNKIQWSQNQRFFKKKNKFILLDSQQKPPISNLISIEDTKINQLRSTPYPVLEMENIFKKSKNHETKGFASKDKTTVINLLKEDLHVNQVRQVQNREQVQQLNAKIQFKLKQSRNQMYQQISDDIEDVFIPSPSQQKGNLKQQKLNQKSKNPDPQRYQTISQTKSHRKKTKLPSQSENKKINHRQSLDKVIRKTNMIRYTGSVAKQCSQTFPKKNDSWRVITLLLYLYRRNISELSRPVYEQALKNQVCSQSQYLEFVQQNQLINACLVRVYERAKKKGLVTDQTEEFIRKAPDFIQRNRQFFRVLYREAKNFVDLFNDKKRTKKSEEQVKQMACVIRVMEAFLRSLRQQFGNDENDGDNENKMNIVLPSIDYTQLNEIRVGILYQQMYDLLVQTAKDFFETVE